MLLDDDDLCIDGLDPLACAPISMHATMGPIMLLALTAICIGASLGAVLRWLLGVWLNPALSQVPMGTLAANLLGGYLVGVAVALFASHPDWPAHWRLLVITGFLGGLTTFSTFSAEVVSLLEQQQWTWAISTTALHLLGSLAMTLLGMVTVGWIRSA